MDVHLIAATNNDLLEEVKNGRFRNDLYYRLAVVPILMPPLRERMEDIPLLVKHLVRKHAGAAGGEETGISVEAMQLFMRYAWPGNVRELENVIQHALAFLGKEKIITPEMLPQSVSGIVSQPLQFAAADRSFREAKLQAVESFEKAYLSALLKKSSGNITHAAQVAGMDRKNLQDLIKKHNLIVSDYLKNLI